jgi:bacteriochlorophyll 4-vinyl reductase
MAEAGIGRVLVASLHQGIADLLPSRLEFYENWLNPTGLRNGTIGLAPLLAVLSFLRREGEAYDLITDRAGEYAAEWTIAGMPGAKRWLIRRLPAGMRAQYALKVSRRLIQRASAGSRANVKLRRGAGTVTVRGSIFCGVRDRSAEPLCRYYATAIARVFLLFNLQAQARVTECRAMGGGNCLVAIAVHGTRVAPDAARQLLGSE